MSGHAELGHFPCSTFDDLIADERAASNSKRHNCKGSITHHNGSVQGGCQVGIAQNSFKRKHMGLLPMTLERVPVSFVQETSCRS